MGMDLTLYPHNEEVQRWTSHMGTAALRLHGDYDLFAQIDGKVMGSYAEGIKQVCKPKPLPPNVRFYTFEDEGMESNVRTDKYGEGLTYVEAWELKKVKLSKETTDWNRAVFALIKALPDSYPVILMWC